MMFDQHRHLLVTIQEIRARNYHLTTCKLTVLVIRKMIVGYFLEHVQWVIFEKFNAPALANS